MPRWFQNSFNSGELSPWLDGRTDTERYANSLHRCENWLLLPGGGATVRPGTIYAGAVKTAAKLTRLLPFIYAANDAVVIEAGDQYVRFWRHNATTGLPEQITSGGGAYEVATTYLEAELAALQASQSGDVVTVTHSSHAPATLSRLAATSDSWKLDAVALYPPPTFNGKTEPTVDLTIVATTWTTSAPYWVAGDLGRVIECNDGTRVVITTVTDASNVVVTNLVAPLLAAYAHGNWWLRDTPGTYLYTAEGYLPPGSLCTFSTLPNPGGAAVASFRASDVGKYLRGFGGIAKIISQTGSACEAEIQRFLADWVATTNDTIAPGTWFLEDLVWTPSLGYPRATGYHEQRAVFGGTATEPDTLRASATGDYTDLGQGTADDHPYAHVLNSGEVCPIQWILPVSDLLVGTLSRIFAAGDPLGRQPLTPTAPRMRPQTAIGACSIAPVVAGDAVLYIGAGQRQVIEMVEAQAGVYAAADLTQYADHLTKDVTTAADRILTGNCVQRQPVCVAWYVRADGTLCGLTYVPAQKVVGWSRLTTYRGTTQDVVESACVIPNPVTKKDALWMVVKRGAARYIEVLDDARYCDCGYRYSGGATASITGLTWLNGQTVAIRGKDATGVWRVYPQQVVGASVANAVVGLNPTVVEAEVGYPVTATLTTNRVEFAGAPTVQGRFKAWAQVLVRTIATPCLQIGTYRFKLDGAGGAAEAGYSAAAAYVVPTGTAALSSATDSADVEVTGEAGWDREGRLTLVQDLPIGGTVLLLGGEVVLGG